MPLLPGKKNVGRNIAELEDNGYPPKQAEAIALNRAGEAKVKRKKHKSHPGPKRRKR